MLWICSFNFLVYLEVNIMKGEKLIQYGSTVPSSFMVNESRVVTSRPEPRRILTEHSLEPVEPFLARPSVVTVDRLHVPRPLVVPSRG